MSSHSPPCHLTVHCVISHAADREKEEQGDSASPARVSYDPGAAVGGTEETTGTNHQCRD